MTPFPWDGKHCCVLFGQAIHEVMPELLSIKRDLCRVDFPAKGSDCCCGMQATFTWIVLPLHVHVLELCSLLLELNTLPAKHCFTPMGRNEYKLSYTCMSSSWHPVRATVTQWHWTALRIWANFPRCTAKVCSFDSRNCCFNKICAAWICRFVSHSPLLMIRRSSSYDTKPPLSLTQAFRWTGVGMLEVVRSIMACFPGCGLSSLVKFLSLAKAKTFDHFSPRKLLPTREWNTLAAIRACRKVQFLKNGNSSFSGAYALLVNN